MESEHCAIMLEIVVRFRSLKGVTFFNCEWLEKNYEELRDGDASGEGKVISDEKSNVITCVSSGA